MGRLNLFDDKDDSSNDDLSKIEINREYAKRLEHNKKREELQRYEELKKQGRVDDSDSEDSSSEDEEQELFKSSKRIDSKFFDALIKVVKKDPVLKNKDAKLFDSESEDDSDSDNESEKKGMKSKKKKPMYLKDVVSKQLIEAGPEFDDDEEMEDDESDEIGTKVKTYSEEQEEIRKEFFKAVEEEEIKEEGDLIKEKNDGSINNEEDGEEIVEKLDVIFGEDGKLDEDSKFLKDYFRNKMWIDDAKSEAMGDDEIEFSEDEKEIVRQEDYEREFNFRFEENAGDRVMGHSRQVEGSVRKVQNARKSQRERKEERKAQAEFERKEELKHLKNLKKKEINEKLEKIRQVAGIGNDRNIALGEDDLEEEFDPEEHDRRMKKAFGDDYYKAEDVDPLFGSDEEDDEFEKPDFDKEDELLGLPKGWDVAKESGEDGDDKPKEAKRKRKRKPSTVEKAVKDELMEEYYKLDYEGTIGDLKTRFKYKPVPAKRFGLKPTELLMMDEKELNQYVPLKKLAPYREKDWKVPRVKTLEIKGKMKELYTGETSITNKKHKKSQLNDEAANEVVKTSEDERSQPKKSNGEMSTQSRKSKRRQRQKELQLPPSRIIAYGKAPSKSKSKNQ